MRSYVVALSLALACGRPAPTCPDPDTYVWWTAVQRASCSAPDRAYPDFTPRGPTPKPKCQECTPPEACMPDGQCRVPPYDCSLHPWVPWCYKPTCPQVVASVPDMPPTQLPAREVSRVYVDLAEQFYSISFDCNQCQNGQQFWVLGYGKDGTPARGYVDLWIYQRDVVLDCGPMTVYRLGQPLVHFDSSFTLGPARSPCH